MNSKTIFTAILFLILMTGITSGQKAETVYIRIQEATKLSGSAWDARMYIIKPDNSTQTVELKRVSTGAEELMANGIVVKTEIEKWLNDGFRIISFTNSGESIVRTEIFLQKDKR